ncbi:MAG: hypothetical protein TREMPRED_001417, partial [Tremellales sp. Tagirdzhanova-0007]
MYSLVLLSCLPPHQYRVMQPALLLTSFILIGSIHAQRTMYQRADGGPIFGPSGQPTMFDIGQGYGNPDCGFIAPLAAIVQVSPDWIRSKLNIVGTTSDASAVTVQMYDPGTLEPVKEDVTWSEGTVFSDDHTSAWWPGAYDHAAIDIGMHTTNGRLGPIVPGDALSAITGIRGLCDWTSSPDQLFDEFQKAQKYDTPIVLVTYTSTKILVNEHAYAIINTSMAD